MYTRFAVLRKIVWFNFRLVERVLTVLSMKYTNTRKFWVSRLGIQGPSAEVAICHWQRQRLRLVRTMFWQRWSHIPFLVYLFASQAERISLQDLSFRERRFLPTARRKTGGKWSDARAAAWMQIDAGKRLTNIWNIIKKGWFWHALAPGPAISCSS